MVLLGNYYYDIKNYELMKISYQNAIYLNNFIATKKLGQYYQYVEKNYEEMKKYFLMGNNYSDLGHYYYYDQKNYEEMKKYYLMGGHYENLGLYYENNRNYEEMKKYYLMGGHYRALGSYYEHIEKNYEEMKKYYLLDGCYISLAYHYEKNNNLAESIKYHLMDIENIKHEFCNNISMMKLVKYFKEDKNFNSNLKFFLFLNESKKKNEQILKKIKELEQTEEVIIYYNKLKTATKDTCFVCLEDKLMLNFNCGHNVCCDCFPNMNKCYYNCK